MSNFAALMALSATQTRKSEATLQTSFAERQRKDVERKKAQEAKEKREREIEAALRKKHLEEAEREKERRKREAQEKAAKDREAERREAEQRDALRYGPKRAKSDYPSARRGGGGGRADGSDDEGGGGLALTREEKRKRRLEQEMRFGVGTSKRQSGGYKKAGRRLPGGAIDVAATGDSSGLGNYRSIREKLASEPAALIKLNVNKRDTRTIDEIVQDLAKTRDNRVLQGDNAKEFADWFGKSKPKVKSEVQSQAQSQAHSQAQSRASSVFGSPTGPSRANSLELDSQHLPQPPVQKAKSTSSTPPFQTKPKPAGPSRTANGDKVPTRGSGISVKAVGGKPAGSAPRGIAGKPNGNAKPMPSFNKVNTSNRPSAPTSKPSSSSTVPTKKRPRSPSYSLSPPPAKKRPAPPKDSLSSTIWAIFGKDRDAYVNRDIMSDDEEDMEAGARDLEQEELFSARVARKEEEQALEEERRHEEEKRRKRKEKDRRGL